MIRWIISFFREHYGKPFDINDIYKCSKQDYSETLGEELAEYEIFENLKLLINQKIFYKT